MKKAPQNNPYRRLGGVKPMSAKEARKRFEGVELEKKDVPAMIIAAFITFAPPLILVIGLLVWFMYRFMLR